MSRRNVVPKTRWLLLAPHFPEYSIRFIEAMATRVDAKALIDAGQFERECEGMAVEQYAAGLLEFVGFRSFIDVCRVVKRIVRFRPTVVHMHEAVGMRRSAISLLVALAFRYRALLVLTVHDPDPHSGSDAKLARRVWIFQALVRRLASVVILHGRNCSSRYRAKGRQQIVTSVHGALLAPVTVRRGSSRRLRFIFFGRMEHYKGVSVLCDALDILGRKQVPNFEVAIVGRGPELDRLEDRLSSYENVSVDKRFIGRVALCEAVGCADVAILPYLSATGSGVLASAFGCGRGVIASEVGDIADTVSDGRNGLLLPPADADRLAELMKFCCEHPEVVESMSRHAVDSVNNELSWSRIVDELLRDLGTKPLA